MTNLQQSEDPQKTLIRKRLANIAIDQSFDKSYTSLNYDTSTFSESKGYGLGVTSDVIYESTSKLPTLLRSNITVDLFKEIVNVAEMGVRMENLPALLQRIAQQFGVQSDTRISKMIHTLSESASDTSQKGELEYFIKLFGQELLSLTLTTSDDYEKAIEEVIREKVRMFFEEMIAKIPMHTVKGYRNKIDIIVPTSLGTPLHITRDLSAVANANSIPTGTFSMEFKPTISAIDEWFVGFKFGPSVGLKVDTSLYTSGDSKVAVQYDKPKILLRVDIPNEEEELLTLENKGYLSIKIPGKTEKVIRSNGNGQRWQSQRCIDSASLQICYEYNLPSPLAEDNFPLTRPSYVKLKIKKQNRAVQGYEVALAPKNSGYGFVFALTEMQESSPVALAALDVGYKKEDERKRVYDVAYKVKQSEHAVKITIEKDYERSQERINVYAAEEFTAHPTNLVRNYDKSFIPSDPEKCFHFSVINRSVTTNTRKALLEFL